MKIKFTY